MKVIEACTVISESLSARRPQAHDSKGKDVQHWKGKKKSNKPKVVNYSEVVIKTKSGDKHLELFASSWDS